MADAARRDHERSAGDRAARWADSPPADTVLRGESLAAADAILRLADLEDAALRLSPWIELTPPTPDGRLGWLADHTTMTPHLTRLIMAAASTRLRISTLLSRQAALPRAVIPQVLSADLYRAHLADLIEVSDQTGRVFASPCLSRCGHPSQGWSDAALALGLPGDLDIRTARACSGRLKVSTADLARAIDAVAAQLPRQIDYREREENVRRLAQSTSWFQAWTRSHR